MQIIFEGPENFLSSWQEKETVKYYSFCQDVCVVSHEFYTNYWNHKLRSLDKCQWCI